MKLVWMFCVLLVGKLTAADPSEETAPAGPNVGSEYMMAFPLPNEDQLAEESAEAVVKTIAESLMSNDDDDDDQNTQETTQATDANNEQKDDKQTVLILEVEDDKKQKSDETQESSAGEEPLGILQAQLEAEEPPKPPRRSLFKRPKIEELRKILGFPPADGAPLKPKPIPQEKPKSFQSILSKPKPKFEPTPDGLQISVPLRREDRLRPFGFPMLPLKRDEGIRPFGLPDIVQAASSILRRAIMDDNDAQDISKEDRDVNENMKGDEGTRNDDDDEDEELMIVPIPDPKLVQDMRSPLFRRFPIPLPFPVPKPMVQNRPRFPVPPLTPVAFFLPIAHQIMQNFASRPMPMPRNHQPFLPVSPLHNMMPIQPAQSQFLQQHFIPLHPPFIPVQQPFQQIVPIQSPFFPMPQQAVQIPIFAHMPHNIPRHMMRHLPRRFPIPQPHPHMARRMPMPNPMGRMMGPQPPHIIPHFFNPMIRRPIPSANRPMPNMVRPPLPPVHPILLMMSPGPIPNHVPIMQQQQRVPVFHPRPIHQQVPFINRQLPIPVPQPEEERIIFVRSDSDDQDEDQEVLILVPTEEIEVAQRPQMMAPRPMMRSIPSPVANPLQRIKLLRELLMARQGNRQIQQHPMSPQNRAARVVEIVQQQLRIFPAHHTRNQQMQAQALRADGSELHPVYVPYPGPQ